MLEYIIRNSSGEDIFLPDNNSATGISMLKDQKVAFHNISKETLDTIRGSFIFSEVGPIIDILSPKTPTIIGSNDDEETVKIPPSNLESAINSVRDYYGGFGYTEHLHLGTPCQHEATPIFMSENGFCKKCDADMICVDGKWRIK